MEGPPPNTEREARELGDYRAFNGTYDLKARGWTTTEQRRKAREIGDYRAFNGTYDLKARGWTTTEQRRKARELGDYRAFNGTYDLKARGWTTTEQRRKARELGDYRAFNGTYDLKARGWTTELMNGHSVRSTESIHEHRTVTQCEAPSRSTNSCPTVRRSAGRDRQAHSSSRDRQGDLTGLTRRCARGDGMSP
jgi:sulfur transfer complex TusBCD TusB component (DsrH family)